MKKEEEDGVDTNAWMVTFSDLLSLLMTFFVMLLSMASMDNKKLDETIGAFSSYLGVLEFGQMLKVVGIKSDTPVFIENYRITKKNKDEEQQQAAGRMVRGGTLHLKGDIEKLIQKEGWQRDIEVRSDTGSMVLVFSESIMYNSGSAAMKPGAKKVLRELAAVLILVEYPIKVEGHTDNRPIATQKYPSNWELSVARAVRVVEFLEELGMNPLRLSAVGYGDSMPLHDNFTEENRKLNRRVELRMEVPEEPEDT